MYPHYEHEQLGTQLDMDNDLYPTKLPKIQSISSLTWIVRNTAGFLIHLAQNFQHQLCNFKANLKCENLDRENKEERNENKK